MFPILAILGSAGLMVLVLRTGTISSGNTTGLLQVISSGLYDILPKRSGDPEMSHLGDPLGYFLLIS